MIPDYRRIHDYHNRTGVNFEAYWSMNNADKVRERLPKAYNRTIYESIDEWFGERPQMNPPHVRDLLNPNDGHYEIEQEGLEEEESGEGEDESPAMENTFSPIDISDTVSGQRTRPESAPCVQSPFPTPRRGPPSLPLLE